jgi:thiol:disulfide interchange protein DsbD
MDVKYFEDKVIFSQKIKRIDKTLKQIKAEVFFSVCDDEKCLAPEVVEFNINLSGDAVENKGDLSSITAGDQKKV